MSNDQVEHVRLRYCEPGKHESDDAARLVGAIYAGGVMICRRCGMAYGEVPIADLVKAQSKPRET